MIAHRIVFETAIAARLLARLGRRDFARVDEDADGHWHFLLRDEIIEYDRHAERAVGVHVIAPVLKDHNARRFGRLVLFRDVNPVIAFRSGKDFAAPTIPRDFAARHTVLRHRVRSERVNVGGECGGDGGQSAKNNKSEPNA